MDNKFIGLGIQLPNPFSEDSGKVISNTGVSRINQSISNILGTDLGERFMVPEFGSKLSTIIFEQNDSITRSLIIEYITDALTKWEPRIRIIKVDPQITDTNTIPVIITYQIIVTNEVVNYVYPLNKDFYELGTKS